MLRKPNVHYCVQKSSPLVPILSHMHPVHTFLLYFSNVILPSMPRSSKSSLTFKFSDQILYALLNFHMFATFPAHLISLDLIPSYYLRNEHNQLLTKNPRQLSQYSEWPMG